MLVFPDDVDFDHGGATGVDPANEKRPCRAPRGRAKS